MDRGHLTTFVSGRLTAMVLLLGFQVLVARALPPGEYARFALVFGVAALVQAAAAFGAPRLTARYISQADRTLTRRTVRRLASRLLLLRTGGCALLLGLATLATAALAPAHLAAQSGFVAIGAAYVVVTTLQLDFDGMAQALMLQGVSRAVAIAEPALRLAGVLALVATAGSGTASGVLAVWLATSVAACAVTLASVRRALAGEGALAADVEPLERRAVAALAWGGHASALAWFATSPAVIRLAAARALATPAFAGFSFAQSLVVSLQRYTPGFMLFPFVEPAVMRELHSPQGPERLRATLSLVVKIDLVCVGAAAVGCAAAARPLAHLLAGGRYDAQAWVLPWLLGVVIANSAYRAVEIAASSFGLGGMMARTLPVSLAWLGAMVLLGSRFAVWPLLLCPLADAMTRLALLMRALSRGAGGVLFDLPTCLRLAALAVTFALVAAAVARQLPSPAAQVATGVAAALAYLAAVAALKPLHPHEAEIVARMAAGGRLLLAPLVRPARAPA